MASYYGDAISSSSTALVSGYRASAGISHGRLRITHSRLTSSATTSDTAYMIRLRSTDRINELFISTDGGGTGGAVNIGLARESDLSVVDEDLFADAVVVTSAAGPTEVFDDRSGGLTAVDRGKQLWELAGDSEDGQEDFYITIDPSTSITGGDTELVLTVTYTAGD